jgi:hypothetical protein
MIRDGGAGGCDGGGVNDPLRVIPAHRALKVRAAQHNRSAETEMRAILEATEPMNFE